MDFIGVMGPMKLRSARLVSFRLLFLGIAHVIAQGGMPSCPCIAPLEIKKLVVKDCLIPSGSRGGQSTRHCLPPDYGMSVCKAWESTSHPSCVETKFATESPGGVSNVWLPDEPLAEISKICAEPWCWVDPEQCDQRFWPSTFFGTTCDDGCKKKPKAYYSYETCGGDSLTWTHFSTRQKHLDAILEVERYRVFMPDYAPYVRKCDPATNIETCLDKHSSCESWMLADGCSARSMLEFCPKSCGACEPMTLQASGACKEGDGVMGKTGFAAVLFDSVLQKVAAAPEMGQPTSRRYHPNGTLEIRGSQRVIILEPTMLDGGTLAANGTWTGCAIDAGLDRIDLCISAFWDTPSKRMAAALTAPVMDDFYRLVTTFSLAPYSVDDALIVFAPVSGEVWGLLLVVTLLVGPLMYFLEEANEEDDEPEEGDFQGDDVNCVTGTCFGVWHAMLSALGAAPTFSPPKSWSARWLMFGYSFFVMVFVAGYTANMTNFLRAPQKMESHFSVQEMMEQDKTACVWSGGSIETMQQLYPEGGSDLFVEDDEAMNSFQFDSMRGASRCNGLITADADARFIINNPTADGIMEHCAKHTVGQPLLPINVVWMVNPRLLQVADALSFLTSELREESVATALQARFFEGQGCSELHKKVAVDARANEVTMEQQLNRQGCQGDGEQKSKSLSYEDLAGLFVCMAFFIAVTYGGWAVTKLRNQHLPEFRLKKLTTRLFGESPKETAVVYSEEPLEERVEAMLEKMEILQRLESALVSTSGLASENNGRHGMAAVEESFMHKQKLLDELSQRTSAIEEAQATLRQLVHEIMVDEHSDCAVQNQIMAAWQERPTTSGTLA